MSIVGLNVKKPHHLDGMGIKRIGTHPKPLKKSESSVSASLTATGTRRHIMGMPSCLLLKGLLLNVLLTDFFGYDTVI